MDKQRPTIATEWAKWRSCWSDTVNGLIVGELEDAKFGLRLIADVERQSFHGRMVEKLVGALERVEHDLDRTGNRIYVNTDHELRALLLRVRKAREEGA